MGGGEGKHGSGGARDRPVFDLGLDPGFRAVRRVWMSCDPVCGCLGQMGAAAAVEVVDLLPSNGWRG